MSQFTLVVIDDTHFILKVPQDVNDREMAQIKDAWDRWKDAGGLLMVRDMATVNSREITIDLAVPEPRQTIQPDLRETPDVAFTDASVADYLIAAPEEQA